MTTALFMLSGIALIALTVALIDWFGRRKTGLDATQPPEHRGP